MNPEETKKTEAKEGAVDENEKAPEPTPEPAAADPGSTPAPDAKAKTEAKEKANTATTVVNINKSTKPLEVGTQENEDVGEPLEKQEEEGDLSGDYGKRYYCKWHYYSMHPIRILFIIGGQYPFYCSKQEDGTYEYKFNWVFPGTIYFLSMICVFYYILIMGFWDMLHITLNVTISPSERTPQYQRQRELEEVLINRYYIPLIFVYSSLIHGCIASVLTIKKRKYIAHYLTFWSRAVYTMHMDVSKLALAFSVKVLFVFIVVVVSISLLASYKFGPSAIGLPTLFGDLLFRLFLPHDGWIESDTSTRKLVQLLGAIFLILTFLASKSAILLFIYHCKLLQSAYAYWNGRVYAAVLRGGEFSQTEEGRTTYKLLFKDHCVLMDLLEGTDQVFAITVESYFGFQVFSLFFELYFCIRAAKHGDNRFQAAYPLDPETAYFVRPKDWAPGLLMLCVSASLMFSAAKSAADVAEEALAGMEVLRRKTMLGRKTDEELYFMLSMFTSYTAYKKMQITGGGYYYMNKDFIIGLVSTVLSYFIILYQFQPVMDKSFSGGDPAKRPARAQYGQFLADIEGLDLDHYETTLSPVDQWGNFRP